MIITIVGMHDDLVSRPTHPVEAEVNTREEVEQAIRDCKLPPNYYVAHVLVDRVVVWKDGEWTKAGEAADIV